MATSPSVAITLDSASSSGIPAATKAPKAATRIASVIGTDSSSAFLKSSENICEIASSALASPNCSIRSPGCARCAAAVAASSGFTSVPSTSLRSSSVTSAAWRLGAICPALLGP